MLALPDKGMSRSVNEHNVNLDVLCDWIEASIVFDDDELSKSYVTDILIEEQIYRNQDFAAERVSDAWAIVARRMDYLARPLGISVSGNRIIRKDEWDQFPAYAFCLALSCVELYSELPSPWGENYVEQGSLFEELAEESLEQTLQGWTVKRVGWSSSNNPIPLSDEIQGIISDLNEKEGADAGLHLTTTTKDLGLDLLAYLSFGDQQPSIPILLVQCASGSNWTSKRHTPDMDLWKKVVCFNSEPVRGFVIPFGFADNLQFRRDAAPVNGLFVERYRLLKPFRQNRYEVSGALNSQLEGWTRPRMDLLPRATQ